MGIGQRPLTPCPLYPALRDRGACTRIDSVDYPNFRVIVVDKASTAPLTEGKGQLWTRFLLC